MNKYNKIRKEIIIMIIIIIIIIMTRNNTDNTSINRAKIIRKQKWAEKTTLQIFQVTSEMSHEITWKWLRN